MRRVSAQFVRRATPGTYGWSAAGVAIVVAFGSVWFAWQAHSERADARAALALAQSASEREQHRVRSASAPPPAPPNRDTQQKEREQPWPSALTAIEAIAMVGVTPTMIEYQALDQSTRLTLEFVDHAQLLAYVAALNEGVPSQSLDWRWRFVSSRNAQGTVPGSATVVGTWSGAD